MMDVTAPATTRELGDYLDVIARAVFRGGMSRQVVDAKWPAIRAAFSGFDPHEVAALGPDEIDAIVANPEVIRNRRKIEAIVANAARLLDIEQEHGSFERYIKSFPDFEAQVKALRRDFKHLGDFGCYFVLYVIGEDVPPPDGWVKGHTA